MTLHAGAHNSLQSHLLSNFLRAVSFISNDGERRNGPIEEGRHHLAVVNLTAGYCQPQGASITIYSRVNLTCATSS